MSTGWPPELREILERLPRLRPEDFPPPPWRLSYLLTVHDTAKWLDSLRIDVAAGPDGARGRLGAIQDDLHALHMWFAERSGRGLGF